MKIGASIFLIAQRRMEEEIQFSLKRRFFSKRPTGHGVDAAMRFREPFDDEAGFAVPKGPDNVASITNLKRRF